MTQNTQSPLSIFTGQQLGVRLMSRSHGLVRPNLVDAFDFTPKLTTKNLPEFDNPVDALIYTTFDGGTGKLSFTDSNQGQINAALMDLDPSSSLQMVNPAGYAPLEIFGNQKGQDGLVKRSMLLYGCQVSGHPFTQTVKEAAKRTIDFSCLNGLVFEGYGMLYTRARFTGTNPHTAPAAVVLTDAAIGGSLTPGDTIYVRTTKVTAAGETQGGPECAVTLNSTDTAPSVTFTTADYSAETGVTSQNVYVSNRSNGERLLTSTVAAGGSVTITALPSTTSVACPNVNTTGSFVTSGDKTWAVASSGHQSITLDKVASFLDQNGLGYVLARRNGQIVASVDNPAAVDTFLISSDGTQVTVNAAEAASGSIWEFITLYRP